MKIRRLSRNVIALGWVSFFNDVATEMLYPVIPIFLTSVLGASTELLGLIEGIAEGGSTILRWLTGAVSDRFRQRKPFVVAGYAISAVSKPVMGLANAWPLFLVGRVSDRVGKSVRTSARDALIADSTAPQYRGAAFGFHRAMDSAGAVLGPLATMSILLLWPILNSHLGWLFFVALAPGIASTLTALLAVRDIPHEADAAAKPPPIFQSYPKGLWLLVLASAVFALGNSSDSFLILRSKQLGLSFTMVVLAYAAYSAVFALTAMPLGSLSDRIGRKPVIIIGWLLFAGVYLGFSAAQHAWAAWVLLLVYGLYQALTDGVTKALITDLTPAAQRGGAIGLFYSATGVCTIAANLITGRLWDVWLFHHQIQAGLFTGAAGAVVATPILALVKRPSR